jgi:tRNA dimethylallyltransferase
LSTASKNKPVAFLFGPTGVGKTVAAAESFDQWAEIVVVDSVQVYRGLDIGSAKPDAYARQHPRHHLLDIRTPGEPFDVGEFVTEADRCVDDILARGKLPVLSGGTAFYFSNFLFGLPATPLAVPQYRLQAQKDWEAWGESRFREALEGVDPVSASRIQAGDRYRLCRAWEVWLQTGRPLSWYLRPGVPRPGYEVRLLGLDRPRPELYSRIEARVDAMFEQGLEEEVRALLRNGYHAQSPGLQGIGYSEFFPWLVDGEGDREQVRRSIALHSRRYAKRQLTFFRSLPGVEWHHPDRLGTVAADLKRWSLTFHPE